MSFLPSVFSEITTEIKRKRTKILLERFRYCCPIVTKIGTRLQTSVKLKKSRILCVTVEQLSGIERRTFRNLQCVRQCDTEVPTVEAEVSSNLQQSSASQLPWILDVGPDTSLSSCVSVISWFVY
jgi:hypothetical protein